MPSSTSSQWPLNDALRNRIRREAIDEIRNFLQVTSETNPLVAIDRYLIEYPNHDSLFKEMHK